MYYKATDRVKRLRQRFMTYKPNVDIERALIYTRVFKESDTVKDEPRIIALAKAYSIFLNERSIYIEEDQLLAGSFGRKPRAFPIYPETLGDSLIGEYRKLTTREIDRFEYSEEDRLVLEEKLHKWHGTGMYSYVFGDMPMYAKKLFLRDPENTVSGGTNIFSLDVPLNGPAGHITPDYQTVMAIGFQGIKANAEKRLELAEAQHDQEGINFLKAVIICADAITNFAHRYADLARKKAETESDSQRKQELLTIAETCDRVPGLPPRTFQECLQAVWFTFIGIQMEAYERCFGCGRLDQYAYPYLKADLETGRITEKQAQELLDCLWMKFPETNYINTEYHSQIASGFPAQQQIMVGGQTPDGKDASNRLSYMCLQASMNTLLHQPSISFRYFEGTPDSLVEQACRLARKGAGHPSFFNDGRCVPALVYKGISLEDARDYSSVGCAGIQPTRKDKGTHNAGYLNVASALELALHDGYWKRGNKQVSIHTGDACQFKSFQEVLDAFEKQLSYLIKVYSEEIVKVEKAHRDVCPTPFVSSFIQDCIGNARDKSAGGALINSGPTPRGIGLADVADSLSALKKWVFEEQKYTIAEVLEAMDHNFEGYEEMRQILSTKTDDYGNDIDDVDDIARKVVEIYGLETDNYRSLYGGRFHPGFSSVSSNVPYGTAVCALPDGRKDYTPLANGNSPCNGADISGPTAVAISCGKLNHDLMSGGSILNVKITPSSVAGEDGLQRFVEYVKGAMAAGVWHVQFNIVDQATLKDAQIHPENYRDLIVRVAGYSAFFTGLSKQLQEDLIRRTEQELR
ncbi:glycyl radical protein [Clostridium transplantifaecale]|uniref:glycyl radical protein n=1 Tax=Clostridium transplantifaecale TaxID=2479838 RepID=UPI000F64104C|nr:formate C-acetyltransferase/glycerol dehydratase family glycyl radical enzyme [Clostridium transplantifaecale]